MGGKKDEIIDVGTGSPFWTKLIFCKDWFSLHGIGREEGESMLRERRRTVAEDW